MLCSPDWDSPEHYDDSLEFPSFELLDIRRLSGSPDMASETSDGTFSMPSTASTVTSTTGSSSNTSQFTGYSSSPVLPPHQQQQNAGYASGRPHARSSAAETLVDFNNHSNGRDLSAPPANDIYKQGPIPYPQQARSHPVETAPSAVRQFNPTQRPEDSPFGFSPFAEPAPSNDFLAQLDSEFRTEPHLLPSVLPSPGNSSYHNPLTSPVDYSQPPYNESSTPHVISPAVHYRPGSTPADGGPLPRPLPPPIATLDRADPQANGGPHSSHPTGHIQSVYDTRPLAAESRGPELQDQPKEEPRKTGRKLPKPTTDLLRKWLLDHADHPYPNEAEKKMLCAKTDLTIVQLGNWMINARRRILAPAARAQAALNAGATSSIDTRARLPGAAIAPNPSASSSSSMISRPQLSPHQTSRSIRGVSGIASSIPTRTAPYPQRSYTNMMPTSLAPYSVKSITGGGRARAHSNSILPVPGAPSYQYNQRERMAPFPSGGIGVGYDNGPAHRARTPPNLSTSASGVSGSPTANIVSPAVAIAASPFQPWSATTSLKPQQRLSRTLSYPSGDLAQMEPWYDPHREPNGASRLADAYGLPPSSNDGPQDRTGDDSGPLYHIRNPSRTHF